MKSYCIYHCEDFDGMCSAAIVKFFLGNTVVLIPATNAGKSLSIFDNIPLGSSVYICDYSYPLDQMVELSKNYNLVWKDHHGIIQDAEQMGFNPDGLRSIKYSGCELTWMFFKQKYKQLKADYKYEDSPIVVKLLGRYDVHDNENNVSGYNPLVFQCGFRSYNLDLDKNYQFWYDLLNEDDHEKLKEIHNTGKIVLKYLKNFNKRYIDLYGYESEINNHRALVVNYGKASNMVFDDYNGDLNDFDYFITYVRKNNKYNVSVYSKKDNVSARELAQRFGGDGHFHAAGFSCEKLPF